jgi:hypothetical protein
MYSIVSGVYLSNAPDVGHTIPFDGTDIPCDIPSTVSTTFELAIKAMYTAEYCGDLSYHLFHDVEFMSSHADRVIGRLNTFHVSKKDVSLIKACIPIIFYSEEDGDGAHANEMGDILDEKHSFEKGTAAHFCLQESKTAREREEWWSSDDPFDYIYPTGDVPCIVMKRIKAGDILVVADFVVDYVATRIVLVLHPRGWSRVRHVLRIRSIVVYWLSLTEKLMAPGGSARKRDREEYEAEGNF